MSPADRPQEMELRRATEPPTLWLSLVLGSVLIHLLLVVITSLVVARTAKVQQEMEPIAVEIVDPTAAMVQTGGAVSDRTTVQGRATVPGVGTSTASNQPSVSDSTSVPPSVEPPLPGERQSFAPQSFAPQSSAPRSMAPRSIAPSSQPRPTTPVRQPSNRLPDSSATRPPTSPPSRLDSGRLPASTLPSQGADDRAGTPPATPQPVTTGSNGGSGDTTARGSTPSGDGSNGEPSLPGVAIDAQRGQGTGLKVTVSNVMSGDTRLIDTLNQLAQPKNSSESLPNLTYPAIVGLNLGQTVKLKVTVRRDGSADVFQVLPPGTVQEYEEFAKTLVSQLSFTPALQAGKPVESLVILDLRIDALRPQ